MWFLATYYFPRDKKIFYFSNCILPRLLFYLISKISLSLQSFSNYRRANTAGGEKRYEPTISTILDSFFNTRVKSVWTFRTQLQFLFPK
jgi:hypothetical protein